MSNKKKSKTNNANVNSSGSQGGNNPQPNPGLIPDIILITTLFWSTFCENVKLLLKFIGTIFGCSFPESTEVVFQNLPIQEYGRNASRYIGVIDVSPSYRYLLDVTFQFMEEDAKRLRDAFLAYTTPGSTGTTRVAIIDLSQGNNTMGEISLSASDPEGEKLKFEVFGFLRFKYGPLSEGLLPLIPLKLLGLYDVIDLSQFKSSVPKAVRVAKNVVDELKEYRDQFSVADFTKLEAAFEWTIESVLSLCTSIPPKSLEPLENKLDRALISPLRTMRRHAANIIQDARNAKDIALKDFLSIPENYAEVLNGVISTQLKEFRAEDLTLAPTLSVGYPGGAMREQIRDNNMFVVKEKEVSLEVGIEGLAFQNKGLATQVISYDGMSYWRQNILNRYRSVALNKYGVITIVLYFGQMPYSGTTSVLKEVNTTLSRFSEEVQHSVKDYGPVVCDVFRLTQEEIDENFPGDFGQVCKVLIGGYKQEEIDELLEHFVNPVHALNLLATVTGDDAFKSVAMEATKMPISEGGENKMNYMGPFIQRQQRIGSAESLFSAYLEGELSPEWGAKQFGVSPAQFRESARLWGDGGRKAADLDAFLSQFSLLPRPSSAGASTSV